MKYQSTISGLGELALDFAADNLLIFFNENAPAELAEISILHTIEELSEDIEVGDVIILSNQEYRVTAVGEEANKTFRQMGHCTFKFTGKSEAELPGHIELQGNRMPDIKVGDLLIVK
ncbi:PTS system, glucitol/sorbitol-specific IIA component [Geosporobacter subterraneus DSM 17957]|uniref:PTS system, glucitol/sorbitol-specific IIA component n=1 Tax=Geosporobacter subterraneus DSM 17957 TaxID=1121919 RepID=A0A1M6IQY1_9FIRM|nr:PTS glucitol/sorbitol transporter subunit IIA [Geosporobacter subterraneus]SHJ36795.1 PTS system, glucitol/sorbitol-specific IIA component [Geosporobacter subterraneus DSM 17957]